jgi:hypothetical protein
MALHAPSCTFKVLVVTKREFITQVGTIVVEDDKILQR